MALKLDTSVANTLIFTLLAVLLIFFTGIWFVLLICLALAFLITSLLRQHLINKRLDVSAGAAVLLTGSSTGIGEDAAIRLASKGVLVFAGVRKPEDGEKLKQKAGNDKIVPILLDVTDEKQINESLSTVSSVLKEKNATLIGIVNNAGYSEYGPLELVPIEKVRRQFDVNVVGQIAVTQAFLPLLRSHNLHKRILFISSGVGRVSFPGNGPYCASKHAIEAIGDSWRMELAPWNIDVVLIEPGAISTEFSNTYAKTRNDNVPKEAPANMDAKVFERYQRYVEESAKRVPKRGHVSLCSDAIEAALFDSVPLTRYLVGSDVQPLPIAEKLPDRLLDLVLRNAWK
jgi:NAD(P)-dependent dehydrogenase (short-subunit alcohol dehydrogenase family)